MNVGGGPDGAPCRRSRSRARKRGERSQSPSADWACSSRTGSPSASSGSPSADAHARAPVVQRQIDRLDRHLAGLGEIAGAALEQQRVADPERPLGRPGGLVLATQEQLAGPQLVDTEAPQQGEKLIAGVAIEAADAAEAFEGALEPALGRPCGSPVKAAAIEPCRAPQASIPAMAESRLPELRPRGPSRT